MKTWPWTYDLDNDLDIHNLDPCCFEGMCALMSLFKFQTIHLLLMNVYQIPDSCGVADFSRAKGAENNIMSKVSITWIKALILNVWEKEQCTDKRCCYTAVENLQLKLECHKNEQITREHTWSYKCFILTSGILVNNLCHTYNDFNMWLRMEAAV